MSSTPAPHKPRPAPAAAPVVEHLPPQWEPGPITPPLPIGVAILSVLIAISAIILLIAGALFLLHYYFPAAVPASILIVSSLDAIGASILVLFGAIMVSVATALWRQESWALWTTVIVVFLAFTYLFFTGSITVLFLIFLVLFIYLITVRHHFY
ncbi:MAG: hypothetical protein L3K17_04255 [Thermoplasmata archaeon]|nr:hypothetical protein [Thermoplasmata archaeon]